MQRQVPLLQTMSPTTHTQLASQQRQGTGTIGLASCIQGLRLRDTTRLCVMSDPTLFPSVWGHRQPEAQVPAATHKALSTTHLLFRPLVVCSIHPFNNYLLFL